MIGRCECGCGQATKVASHNDHSKGWVKGQPLRFVLGHGGGTKPGHLRTHGMTGSVEHHAYVQARSRCHDANRRDFDRYGGRGIQFKFESFEEFYAELGPRPAGMSLDRWPDNNGPHARGNVRWSSQSAQNSNREHFSAAGRARMSAGQRLRRQREAASL